MMKKNKQSRRYLRRYLTLHERFGDIVTEIRCVEESLHNWFGYEIPGKSSKVLRYPKSMWEVRDDKIR